MDILKDLGLGLSTIVLEAVQSAGKGGKQIQKAGHERRCKCPKSKSLIQAKVVHG